MNMNMDMAGIKRSFESADDRGEKRAKVKDVPQNPIFVKKKKPGGPRSLKAKAKKKPKISDANIKEEPGFISFADEAVGASGAYGIHEGKQSKSLAAKDRRASGVSKIANGGGAPSKGDFSPFQQDSIHTKLILTICSTVGPSSRESHEKQKQLAQVRKAAKPNADSIARSKKLWERLRRKSHVPMEERKELVAELYAIITGRVKEFVFKHDSVRVIQTALKYANSRQRKAIAQELKGDYRSLAQSKYSKFLIGKLLVHGDEEIRDMIIPEFYGLVKHLIRHPEASWILDDIYRTVATIEQKGVLLREWYGTEFAIFQDADDVQSTADLSQILAEHPEKRGPIMQHLHELINHLIQKKTTGFTMLHDAMLQYFLNIKSGSSEATEFIELLKGDEEGDLVKNMAFTKSGSRLACLCLTYSTAKDRKLLLRMYRNTMKMLAGDIHGHMVILAAYEVIDDTKLTQKAIFPELLSLGSAESARHEELLQQVNDLTARIPLLYLLAQDKAKWLLTETDQQVLDEIRQIRTETSKKNPAVRQRELISAASPIFLKFIASSAELLVESSFGCQFITEVLFGADGDKTEALVAVATAAKSKSEVILTPTAGRMLKSLVQGGRFNNRQQAVEKVKPLLNFHTLLYERIESDLMSWATGSNAFVVVALVESEDFKQRDVLIRTLQENRSILAETAAAVSDKRKKGEKPSPASSAAKLLLEKIG
jgi:pumilio family protein 6